MERWNGMLFFKRNLHILMLVITLVCFFIAYQLTFSGIAMILFVGIPAVLTGWLFANKNCESD